VCGENSEVNLDELVSVFSSKGSYHLK